MATVSPAAARRPAACSPAGPAPITTTSYVPVMNVPSLRGALPAWHCCYYVPAAPVALRFTSSEADAARTSARERPVIAGGGGRPCNASFPAGDVGSSPPDTAAVCRRCLVRQILPFP